VGINDPARRFVALVSNVYHEYESQLYDAMHPEVLEVADYWSACLQSIRPELPPAIEVLDIGAGTGFASEQVLKALGEQVSHLVCLDLSPGMIAKCKESVQRFTDRATFIVGDPTCLLNGSRKFDLVITNSVLHHLIDLPAFFNIIVRVLRPGGIYVAGHEPSSDFYSNAELYRWTQVYRRWRRLRRLVNPEPYLNRLKVRPKKQSLEQLTCKELMRRGVIKAPLPMGIIRQLVDIHVPPASPETPFWGEQGFNARDLCQKFLPSFEISYVVTYPHIKDARTRMGPVWSLIDKMLARKYPASGANFMMAVKRKVDHERG
jgi:ubiquinone/menaquinone biosynthesis C-methylase UbiE